MTASSPSVSHRLIIGSCARAKAAAAAVNGCVAFSIKNKPEGSGIDNYTVKFFNEECFEEGELMSQSDFTVI